MGTGCFPFDIVRAFVVLQLDAHARVHGLRAPTSETKVGIETPYPS